MSKAREDLILKLRMALENRSNSEKLWGAMTRARESRASTIQKLGIDIDELKETNRSIKIHAIAISLIEKFAAIVSKNGGHVFFAKTGEDATNYVTELAKRTGTKLIVKSKSLTSDEIEFNGKLEREGIKCVETDLGELIIQLLHEKPIHLVMPAAHKSVDDVAEIFSKEIGKRIPPQHDVILRAVREYLRPIFLSADMGVTGANIGIAETGTIILETNEGNGRLVTSIPRIHVVIIGMEKIVESWNDAAKLVMGHAVSATGQSMTVYVSAITQHVRLAGSSNGREFHVIILDNGRSKMKKDAWFRDALNCIRCGACMNICPTYGIAGGHTFGYIYPGPIGIPWTANVHGLDKATFAHLCISCGLCKEICPIDIDIPMMIAKVKEEEINQRGQPLVNKFFIASESLAKMASATAPLSNWMMRRTTIRYFMEKLFGVDRRRALPSFSRKRLRSRLKNIGAGTGSSGRVVFFPDVYADYNDPELGVRAIKLLQSLGYSIEVPDLKWSGMPYISYGDIDRATRVARYNLKILERYVSDGCKVVSTEPTVIYMLREIYPKLIPEDLAIKIEESSSSFFEFVQNRIHELELKPSHNTGETIGFHIPCHDRAISNGAPAIKFLQAIGYKVQIVESGTCCGMGGTFGMKHGVLGYDLSLAVGDRLFKLFKESGCRLIASESSICAIQLTDGTAMNVLHPLYMVKIE
jgi:iron-sulfur cluster protein